jgi:hypothetical protein
VADPVFTEAEWQSLQTTLDARAQSQPARRQGGATRFLSVLVCADCGTNTTVHKTKVRQRSYAYLRFRNCSSGGLGAPDPQAVHSQLFDAVAAALGAKPVQVREYRSAIASRSAQNSDEKAAPAPAPWTLVPNGDIFRDRWERGGREIMAEDLRGRASSARCVDRRFPAPEHPKVHLELTTPKGTKDRLVIRNDAFADQ